MYCRAIIMRQSMKEFDSKIVAQKYIELYKEILSDY